jgi:hypothetical protein
VATWQADFHVIVSARGLPADYRDTLARMLPPSRSWGSRVEIWGTEDGDRIDVSTYEDGSVEIFARFDLRQWQATLYEQFLAFVRSLSGRLQSADSGAELAVTPKAFQQALLESPAADFVRGPEAHLRKLRDQPIRMPEEP